MKSSVSDNARALALRTLEGLPERVSHTAGVATVMSARTLQLDDQIQDELVAAAWLHDIGYAADLASSGFHPLDGAQFVSEMGYSALVVSLIAHHSGAAVEAEERGLDAELSRFPLPDSRLLDLLTFADMTTGPTGEGVTVEARLNEILGRYPKHGPVFRAVTKSAFELIAAVERVRSTIPDTA